MFRLKEIRLYSMASNSRSRSRSPLRRPQPYNAFDADFVPSEPAVRPPKPGPDPPWVRRRKKRAVGHGPPIAPPETLAKRPVSPPRVLVPKPPATPPPAVAHERPVSPQRLGPKPPAMAPPAVPPPSQRPPPKAPVVEPQGRAAPPLPSVPAGRFADEALEPLPSWMTSSGSTTEALPSQAKWDVSRVVNQMASRVSSYSPGTIASIDATVADTRSALDRANDVLAAVAAQNPYLDPNLAFEPPTTAVPSESPDMPSGLPPKIQYCLQEGDRRSTDAHGAGKAASLDINARRWQSREELRGMTDATQKGDRPRGRNAASNWMTSYHFLRNKGHSDAHCLEVLGPKPQSERQRDPVGWAQRHPVEAARLAEDAASRKGKGGSKGSSGQKGCGQQSYNTRS